MNPLTDLDLHTQRTRVNLALAMAITGLVAIINVGVNQFETLQRYLQPQGASHLVGIVINGLFLWLVILLALAFLRWRSSEQSRRALRSVIEGINPDSLLVVSPDRTIQMCSPTVQPMFGYTPDELRGLSTDRIYLDRRQNPRRPREIYEALERRGYHVGIATGLRRNGSRFPMEIITGDLHRHDGAVLLLRDITDRVGDEERRHQQEEQMRRQQYLESLGVLTGGVAHDFNNILTGVLGNADLALTAEELPADVRDNLREIVVSAQRAATICRDLLAYAGRCRAHLEPIDINKALQEDQDATRALIPVHIEWRWEPTETPPVLADAHQIRQLVMNLVSNAVEAIGVKPGTVTVSTGVRTCDAAYLREARGNPHPPPGSYVFIAVTDTGDIIEEANPERVFEPFFSTRFPGRGLGLASALGIMRGHHGVLHIHSTAGEGSVFTALLPMHTSRPAPSAAPLNPHPPTSSPTKEPAP